jgi:hypothetical protein
MVLWIGQVELLKFEKDGEFPDESEKTQGSQIHSGDGP